MLSTRTPPHLDICALALQHTLSHKGLPIFATNTMQVVPAVRDLCYPAQLRASNADAYERWTSCRCGTVVYAVLRARALTQPPSSSRSPQKSTTRVQIPGRLRHRFRFAAVRETYLRNTISSIESLYVNTGSPATLNGDAIARYAHHSTPLSDKNNL